MWQLWRYRSQNHWDVAGDLLRYLEQDFHVEDHEVIGGGYKYLYLVGGVEGGHCRCCVVTSTLELVLTSVI